MAQRKSLKQLSKFISYALGRNPAEFGLVPNPDGYVKIKEFLKVLCEEEGLRHVRRSHINELLITLPHPPFEIKDNHIRATHRHTTLGYTPAKNLPKLLYTCVRKKAYPTVLAKGILPMGFSHVILSSNPEMAQRIGHRKDITPVLLIIQTQKSRDQGIIFYEAGEDLYLAESVSPECFTGPPLPKQKKPTVIREIPAEEASKRMPGSFLMEIKEKNAHTKKLQGPAKKGKIPREKDLKKLKKHKRKRERPPWRS